MKAKKKYNTGGILPPAIEALRKRAAKKKKESAPVYGGLTAETTVVAKAPTESERIKREVNKPVGSDFTFIGDPSGIGKIGKLAKVAKSLLKSKGYKVMAKVAGKRKKLGTERLRDAQSRANTFDALQGMRGIKEGRISNKIFNRLAEKVRKGGANPRMAGFGSKKSFSDKEIAKRMSEIVKRDNAKGAAYKKSLEDFKPR